MCVWYAKNCCWNELNGTYHLFYVLVLYGYASGALLVCYLCYLDVYADVYVAFYAVYSAVFCCYAAETIVMPLLSGSGKNTRGLPLPATGGGYGKIPYPTTGTGTGNG